jgi:anti-sigma B factor antagonist
MVMASSSGPGSTALPEFVVRVGGDDRVPVYSVAGELDLATATVMDEALSASCSAPAYGVVVDVSQLRFMDAAGLKVLVSSHNRLIRGGRAGLVVRGASGVVRRVFELTGLTFLLEDQRPAVGEVPAAGGSIRPRLDRARREAGQSVRDLFVAYFALGGTADLDRLSAFLGGDVGALDDHQRDVATHAVNERLIELGRHDSLLTYLSDGDRPS